MTGTPQARKLGLKAGTRVALDAAPDGWELRSCALELGLVDVKVAAVDEDWSGLRLVWRTSNRVLSSRG